MKIRFLCSRLIACVVAFLGGRVSMILFAPTRGNVQQRAGRSVIYNRSEWRARQFCAVEYACFVIEKCIRLTVVSLTLTRRLMLSRIIPRLAPRVSALPTPVRTMTQRSHIFTPMDWMFYYFPNYSRDKVALMARQIKIHFAIGFCLVFFVYHPPYKGADYENFHKSPLFWSSLAAPQHRISSFRYWYKHNKLERTGQLQENLRIKRDWFYDEDPSAKKALEG